MFLFNFLLRIARFGGKYEVWKERSAECGVWKMGVWKMGVWKMGVWKMRSVENEECGKCWVWKIKKLQTYF